MIFQKNIVISLNNELRIRNMIRKRTMEIKNILEEFVRDNGLKQMILIGTYGAIRNIEINEIMDDETD